MLILEIQVCFSIEAQADMSCGCVCQSVSPPLSRNTLRNSDTIFLERDFASVLLERRRLVHCTAVRSMKRGALWGKRGGGPQVHSLSVTCTPQKIGEYSYYIYQPTDNSLVLGPEDSVQLITKFATGRHNEPVSPIRLQRAESFLKSEQFLRQTRNSPHFTQPTDSLPRIQNNTTCPYPKQHQSRSRSLPILFL